MLLARVVQNRVHATSEGDHYLNEVMTNASISGRGDDYKCSFFFQVGGIFVVTSLTDREKMFGRRVRLI